MAFEFSQSLIDTNLPSLYHTYKSMKSFQEYITEVFDRPLEFSLFSKFEKGAIYAFRYMEHNGKIHSINKQNNNDLITSLGLNEKESIPMVTYRVWFRNGIFSPVEAKELGDGLGKSEKEIREGIYDASFERYETVLERKNGSWVPVENFTGDGSDDDLSRLSSKESLAVFATVMAVAQKFVSEYKPLGIYYAIKRSANMAKLRIYDRIASRNGGKLVRIPTDDSPGRKGATMVWFG